MRERRELPSILLAVEPTQLDLDLATRSGRWTVARGACDCERKGADGDRL